MIDLVEKDLARSAACGAPGRSRAPRHDRRARPSHAPAPPSARNRGEIAAAAGRAASPNTRNGRPRITLRIGTRNPRYGLPGSDITRRTSAASSGVARSSASIESTQSPYAAAKRTVPLAGKAVERPHDHHVRQRPGDLVTLRPGWHGRPPRPAHPPSSPHASSPRDCVPRSSPRSERRCAAHAYRTPFRKAPPVARSAK